MLLYLDCTGGISGDMTLAALAHLGVDFAPLVAALARAGVDCRIDIRDEIRPGGPGCVAAVSWNAEPQPMRHPADIAAIFEKVAVAQAVRRRALAALAALTEAEAHAHQIAPAQVHFHEVGAIDTLVDILGAAYGVEALGATQVAASPLPWFTGSVECAHGRIPLPAPATAFLLRGKPVFATEAREELVTPTGAALVHALADQFLPGPEGVPQALGTGYGTRPAPAGLRAWLVQGADGGANHALGGREPVTQFESHIDHLNGEDLGMALEALSAMPEVLDVLWLPGVGKKNRPAGLLRVLCLPRQRGCVETAVLRHTHTLGLRVQTLDRIVAPRRSTVVETAGQRLAAKEYDIEGKTYVRPEADAVKAAAGRCGVGAPALRNTRDKN